MADHFATGFDELDRLLGGGMPLGGIALTEGAVGTGKTQWSQFLARAALRAEIRTSILDNEMDFDTVYRRVTVGLTKKQAKPLSITNDLSGYSLDLLAFIERELRSGVKFMVLDPLSMLLDEKARDRFTRTVQPLDNFARSHGATLLFVVQTKRSARTSRRTIPTEDNPTPESMTPKGLAFGSRLTMGLSRDIQGVYTVNLRKNIGGQMGAVQFRLTQGQVGPVLQPKTPYEKWPSVWDIIMDRA